MVLNQLGIYWLMYFPTYYTSDGSSVALVGSPADIAQNLFSSVLYHQLAIGGGRIQGHLNNFSSYLEV